MTLLALDLGTNLGWATASRGTTASGEVVFKTGRFQGGGMRFLQFRRWLDQLHEATPLTECVFEEVHAHKGVDAAHVYGGFKAALTAWCEEKEIPYEGIGVQAIKKFATGKHNCKKDAMVAAAKSRWSMKGESDNEADALALLHYRISDLLS